MNSMLVKLATNFPKDGQRIAVIGTNKIVKLTVTSSGVRRKFSWGGWFKVIWWLFVFGVRYL